MTTLEADASKVAAHTADRDSGTPTATQSEHRYGQRRLPDIVTRDEDGHSVTAPERLANVAGDTMTLHTSEALRLFIGQAGDVRWRVEPLVGGKHFASALKEMWFLSARDHPYADWMLIRAYDELTMLRARITDDSRTWQGTLDDIRRKGLSMNVMASARPVGVSLGFRSPYGYAVAAAIVEFDYYVRLLHTLVQKDQLAPAEGQNEIFTFSKTYYTLFRKSMQCKRLLLHEHVKGLTRRDFAADADDESCRRVRAALGYFGELPRSVLLREDVPRHVRQTRRVPLSAMRDGSDDPLPCAVSDVANAVQMPDQPPQLVPVAAPDVSRETSAVAVAAEQHATKAATL